MTRKLNTIRERLNELEPGWVSKILIESLADMAVRSRRIADRNEARRLLCFAVAMGYRYPGEKPAHEQSIDRIGEMVRLFGAPKKQGDAAIAAIREASEIANNATTTKRMIRQSRRYCKAEKARLEASRMAAASRRS